MKTRKLRYDIILIVSLLVLSSSAVALTYFTRRDGRSVSVEIDGECVAVYSLDKDGEYSLRGGSNILVIENGSAYIREADCPDRTCVRAGRIRHVGEAAVCLPNRLSVTVIGDSTDGAELVS